MKPRRWHQRVLHLLESGKWCSTNGVLDSYIATYGTKYAPTRTELSLFLNEWSDEVETVYGSADTAVMAYGTGDLIHDIGQTGQTYKIYRRRLVR